MFILNAADQPVSLLIIREGSGRAFACANPRLTLIGSSGIPYLVKSYQQ